MLSKIPPHVVDQLSVRELEVLLERKRRNRDLGDLLQERDRLRLELRRIDDAIDAIEGRSGARRPEHPRGGDGDGAEDSGGGLGRGGGRRGSVVGFGVGVHGDAGYGSSEPFRADDGISRSFLAGKRKRNLKDYIAQVLLDAREPLSPSDIQKRLPEAGYVSHSTNPRSFYNTVFQALQRYDIFRKERKKYCLTEEALKENGVKEILPKKKTRLKDFIIEVLDQSESPLKVSEIASRVVIAGYETDLEMDELCQRVSATLKKYLNKDFDWDSQRYKLANRNN